MKKKYILTGLIAFLFLLFLAWTLMVSIWGINQDQQIPGWVKAGYLGTTILIIVPIMIMMIVTAVRRKKEIDEEDEDDLSQY
ncbi:hypothetical protein [Oceanispirochaeta sp.]|uniref:hypothetical protein n=1 Tax=Oceanispirochaeta sp. TaxID=2035350 RepID=UPI00262D6AA1|nr:hypothetical protein [Oceanispirochaeta sp.]MDA3956643.1 hypothetical protein [Oceanispirochaeta sp.]